MICVMNLQIALNSVLITRWLVCDKGLTSFLTSFKNTLKDRKPAFKV